jgi:hypothetical protein
MPSDGSINAPLVFCETSVGNSQIDLSHRTILELFDQMMVGPILLGNDQDARGILIQAMHNPWPQDSVDSPKVLTIIEKGIDQCARRVPVSRMDDHSRRFIDDDDRGVFVKNGQGKGFWHKEKGLRFGKDSRNNISGSQTGAGFGRFLAEKDIPCFDQFLGLRPGEVQIGF